MRNRLKTLASAGLVLATLLAPFVAMGLLAWLVLT